MSNCVDCSGEDREHRVGVTGNVNPLDCNNQFMQCGNPCRTGPKNTPHCETLPSQIQNFTDQFFGTVVKTEINGAVVWSLPCSLDTGLPNNPRAQGEGLACYFLRLFRDGIGGLSGPRGVAGLPGTNGTNTYTVLTQRFNQPTVESPLVQVVVIPNPAIIEGIGVFIEGSGTYEVTDVAPGGVVFLTLVSPVDTPLAVIPSGSIVVPVGFPRAGVGPVGPQGPDGKMGVPGLPGVNGTAITNTDNGTWSSFAPNGGNLPGIGFFVPTGAYSQVVLGTQTPKFLPVAAGKYLVTAVLPVVGDVTAGNFWAVLNNSVTGQYGTTISNLKNLTTGAVLPCVISAVVTTSGVVGETISIYAYTDAPGTSQVDPFGVQLTWVRVA